MNYLFSFFIKTNSFSTALPLIFLLIVQSSYGMDIECIKSVFGPTGPIMSLCPSVDPLKSSLENLSKKIKDKIPEKMKKLYYWNNSFINGIKTNIVFALVATVTYPLGSKKALILQSTLLAKNIICFRAFSNNEDSSYCNLCFPSNGRLIDYDHVLTDNRVFLNDLVAPYSFILVTVSAIYGVITLIMQHLPKLDFVTAKQILKNGFLKKTVELII